MTKTMLMILIWCRLTIIAGRHKLSQLIVELHLPSSSFAFPLSSPGTSYKFSSSTASSMLIVSHMSNLHLSCLFITSHCDSKHLISRLAFSTILSCPLCIPACVLSRGSCLVWAAAACLTHGRLRQQLRRGTNSNAAAAVSPAATSLANRLVVCFQTTRNRSKLWSIQPTIYFESCVREHLHAIKF